MNRVCTHVRFVVLSLLLITPSISLASWSPPNSGLGAKVILTGEGVFSGNTPSSGNMIVTNAGQVKAPTLGTTDIDWRYSDVFQTNLPPTLGPTQQIIGGLQPGDRLNYVSGGGATAIFKNLNLKFYGYLASVSISNYFPPTYAVAISVTAVDPRSLATAGGLHQARVYYSQSSSTTDRASTSSSSFNGTSGTVFLSSGSGNYLHIMLSSYPRGGNSDSSAYQAISGSSGEAQSCATLNFASLSATLDSGCGNT